MTRHWQKIGYLAAAILGMAGVWSACAAPKAAPPDKVTQTRVSQTAAHHGWSVNYPKQRKLFWIHKQFWLFYSDGKDAVVRTSPKGHTWSRARMVKKGAHYGHRIGFWFDGQWIHYAHNAAGAGESVVYRRGKPDPGGTILWSQPEQEVYTIPSGHNVMYPKVIVDATGRPWISFVQCKGGPHNAPYDAIITASSTHDGTWKTRASFPHRMIKDNPDSYPDVTGTPMAKGKVFWMVNQQKNKPYLGQEWDGKAWKAKEQVSVSGGSHGLFNILAEGDTVHAAYRAGGVKYRRRSKGVWGSEFHLSSTGSGHTSLTLIGPGHLMVSWLDVPNHRVEAREFDKTWQEALTIANVSKEKLSGSKTTVGINFNAIVQAPPHVKLALALTTGANGPFQIHLFTLQR